jgi:hypothetical protein
MPLLNAAGDVDLSSAGYKFLIDTLSYIRKRIVSQKFYEIDIADYLPVDVGEAAWSSEIVQNAEFYDGGSFFEGDVEMGGSRISRVDAAFEPNRMPVRTWRKKTSWMISEIEQAAVAGNWDPVEAKLRSLKKNWDLGIQELAFLGRPNDSVMTGLLNNAAVTINTALIGENISSMTTAQFATFVASVLAVYQANANYTALPDRFIIPTDDYLGLGVPVSQNYPNIAMLDYLQNMFAKMTGNPGFKILPLTYAQKALNNSLSGLNKHRYVLYRCDPETLSLSIPVDFTMLEARTLNGFDWEQLAYGQYSGVLVNRIREVLYIDNAA